MPQLMTPQVYNNITIKFLKAQIGQLKYEVTQYDMRIKQSNEQIKCCEKGKAENQTNIESYQHTIDKLEAENKRISKMITNSHYGSEQL